MLTGGSELCCELFQVSAVDRHR